MFPREKAQYNLCCRDGHLQIAPDICLPLVYIYIYIWLDQPARSAKMPSQATFCHTKLAALKTHICQNNRISYFPYTCTYKAYRGFQPLSGHAQYYLNIIIMWAITGKSLGDALAPLSFCRALYL